MMLDNSNPQFIIDLMKDPSKNSMIVEENISFEEFKSFILRVYPIIKNFKPLEIKDDFDNVMIIGDIHGDIVSLSKIIQPFLNGTVEQMIFLGDYVDRGKNSLSVLLIIIALQINFPDRIIMLKGNHEDIEVNGRYGFRKDIQRIFPNSVDEVEGLISAFFDELPIAAITKQKSFCIHAGICREPINREILMSITKPYGKIIFVGSERERVRNYEIFHELQWNDPNEEIDEFAESKRGRNIYNFGIKPTLQFLNKMDVNRIIRAHEAKRGGYQSLFDGKLIHIFSSQPYFGRVEIAYVLIERNNKTAIVKIDDLANYS